MESPTINRSGIAFGGDPLSLRESPVSRMRMKWDDEPQELPPGCPPLLGERGRGEGLFGLRFMGSPVSQMRMKWDDEPQELPPGCPLRGVGVRAGAKARGISDGRAVQVDG
jgi:hypothetical protein